MPQEPKRRHSRERKGKRRASIHLAAVVGVKCANCGAIIKPHFVCKKCGYYKGVEIIKTEQRAVVTRRTVAKESEKQKEAEIE